MPKQRCGATNQVVMASDQPRPWCKHLWGVLMHGTIPGDRPILLGALWHDDTRHFEKSYPGEPTRALLFQSRREARQWCADTHAKWRSGRQRDAIVARWRVVPVRVCETVDVVAP